MKIVTRTHIVTKGVTQRPLLVIEGFSDEEGYPATYVAQPHDQRNKITGQVLAREEYPDRIYTPPTPPTPHMLTYQLLLADTIGTDQQATARPLSIHQNFQSVIQFINEHRQLGYWPVLYRLHHDQNNVGTFTLSKPFDMSSQKTFELEDRYDPVTRTGFPTITQPDLPWAVVLPRSKTIRVDGQTCEQFIEQQRAIRVPEATNRTPYTLMLRDNHTKEPLSLHTTTESVLFYGMRHVQMGRQLELVDGNWNTIRI